MNPWLLLLIGLALGAIAAWLMAAAQLREEQRRAAASAATAQGLREQQARDNEETQQLRRRLEQEQMARAASEASLQAERRNLEEQRRRLDEADQRLGATFKLLSADVLATQSRSFLELAVNPLKDSLVRYEDQIHQMEQARQRSYGNLETELKSLMDSNEKLRRETGNLTLALRGGPQVRGRWGEMTLRRVVELAGMSEHCDFSEQETLRGDSGRARPDMIVNLPGGRRIAVDAKAPLQAFLMAAAATSEPERNDALARHSQLVRAHLNQLAERAYWDQLQPMPEMVVLFLPGESFFSAALEQDPALIEDGMEKRVVVATPTTLIALLRAVAYGWRQEQIQESAQRVSDLGKQVYDRMRVFVTHFAGAGSSLRRAVEDYNRAASSLESRVLISARKFKELGAATGDDLEEAGVIDEVPRAFGMPEQNGNVPMSPATSKQAASDEADEDPKALP